MEIKKDRSCQLDRCYGNCFKCTDLARSSKKTIGVKSDKGKIKYGLIPVGPLRELARILTFGANKYAPNNWQKVENPIERYTDALYRHIELWRGGEKLDKESGLHHLAHAVCNAMFLLYFELKKDNQ